MIYNFSWQGASPAKNELGHDFGFVWKNLNGFEVDKGHYQYVTLPGTLLLMNVGAPLDVKLGHRGDRTWTAYDKLHLQHQYVFPKP